MTREDMARITTDLADQFKGTTKYSKSIRRGNSKPLDASSIFATYNHAYVYALNDIDGENYVPCQSQIISVESEGKAYILRKYGDDVRFVNLPADGGDIIQYEIKHTDRNHYYLEELNTGSVDTSKFLRSDRDSSNGGYKLSVGSLDVKKDITLEGSVYSQGTVSGKEVNAKTSMITPLITASEVLSGNIHTDKADAQQGFMVSGNPSDGYSMFIDNLTVRNKLHTEELELAITKYIGGKLIITQGGGIECSSVEYNNVAHTYKCYFKNEQGDDLKHNPFVLGDLALCEKFEGLKKFYWREVVETGNDYIVLSDANNMKHPLSDMPSAGDVIVHCGNRDGGSRATAIVLSSADTNSPFIAQYNNITTFAWPTPITKFSLDGNYIKGNFVTDSGVDVSSYIETNNGELALIKQNMQSLNDEFFVIWQGDYQAPTTGGIVNSTLASNTYEPSKSWTSNTERDTHTGDYLITTDGIVYVYKKSGSNYIWDLVTDKYLISAIEKANNAQSTANSALTNANNAQATADDAQKAADDAKRVADTAQSNADKAKADATEAKSIASEARTTADQAKDNADKAKTDSASALEKLSGIAEDSTITIYEKGQLKMIWDVILSTNTQILSDATKYGVSSTQYTTSFNTLKTMVENALNSQGDYTIDNTTTYNNAWNDFYTKQNALYSAIATATKKLADDAQKAADDAQNTADTAQDNADQAKKDAEEAQSKADQAKRDAEEAKRVAEEAKTNADNAKTAADNAKVQADKAIDTLANMASDNIITAQEKSQLKSLFDSITATKTQLVDEASKYSVASTTYQQKYTLLKTLVDNILKEEGDSTISNVTTYNNTWANYYSAENSLYSAIATAANKLANDASSVANAASTTANAAKAEADEAKKNADDAKKNADDALVRLDNIANDGVITEEEKPQLRILWTQVCANYAENIADAQKYSVSTTEYAGRYTALSNYITPILSENGEIEIEDVDEYKAAWTNYFAAETSLLNSITIAAKKIADDAQTAANNALSKLASIADDKIISPSEKADLKEWWENEKQEYSSISALANDAYANYTGFRIFAKLYTLANTLVGNVLANMSTDTRIDRQGSISVSAANMRDALEDPGEGGSGEGDSFLWTDFWPVYYKYKSLAQNTATEKAKVFITGVNTLPTPPYKVGDLWICESYTNRSGVGVIGGGGTVTTYVKETFRCVTKRNKGQTPLFADWTPVTDETSSHMEKLSNSIKLWVGTQYKGLEDKVTKSGIDILASGVKVYYEVEEGGQQVQKESSLFEVSRGQISLNGQLITVSGDQIDLSGKDIDMSADSISITSTNFEVDEDGNVIAKNITASGGYIGNLAILSGGLVYRPSGSNTYVVINQDAIFIGENPSVANAKYFRANRDGSVTATSADIKGKITATSGKIAGLEINSNYMSYENKVAGSGNYFYFGEDGLKTGVWKLAPDGQTLIPDVRTSIYNDGTVELPGAKFNPNGSGNVAKGKLSWDVNGNATLNGNIKASAFYYNSKFNQSGSGTYNLNPATDGTSFIEMATAKTFVLPKSSDHVGLEYKFLCPTLTRTATTTTVKAQSGDAICSMYEYSKKYSQSNIGGLCVMVATSQGWMVTSQEGTATFSETYRITS